MSRFDYDFISLGGGAAGLVAAKFSAKTGNRTAIFDKKRIGGECTWSGCIPSKSLLSLAHKFDIIRNPTHYGLNIESVITSKHYDPFSKVRETVQKVYNSHTPKHLEAEGIHTEEEVETYFVDNHTVKINGKNITARKILIATGSSPFVPPIPGLEDVDYLTNENLFNLKSIPESINIIGGGPIGCEMAYALNGLGTKVTLIELGSSIMVREEEELTRMLITEMRNRGISILTNTKASSVEKLDGITVHCAGADNVMKISGQELLIAIGRSPNIDGLNLEAAGVKYTPKGIVTDRKLRTSTPNIFAAGDVTGPYQFSHMAEYQAVTAASNALLPISRKLNYDHVPWVTFTKPEFARTGLTEKEAREIYGPTIRIYSYDFKDSDRAKTDDNALGKVKVICNNRWKILGVSIFGERAGEIMQEAHLAKTLNIPFYKIAKTIHAYPLYSDVLRQPAKKAWIDSIQNNIFIKIVKFLRGGK